MIFRFFLMAVLPYVVHTNTLYLNSCKNCEETREFEVKPDVSYIVEAGSNTDACNRECPIHFNSTRNNSWLCLAQIGLESQINDSNIDFFVYDNRNQESQVINLEYYPDSIENREICHSTNYMQFLFKKINSHKDVNYGKVRVQLKILDIESKERVIYLDGSYCHADKYLLLNSEVSVYNRPQDSEVLDLSTKLANLCGMPISLVDVEEVHSKRICFTYTPSDHIDCGSNWKFSVSSAGYSLDSKNWLYSLNCNETKARIIHYWCADSGIQTVTLVLQRDKGVDKSKEYPKMFHFVFLDYNGTVESLSESANRSKNKLIEDPPDTPAESNSFIIYIIIVVCVILFVVVAVFVVKRYRHQQQCFRRYNPVARANHKQQPSSNGSPV